MPQSNFKHRLDWLNSGAFKCPTFEYESARDWDMKIRMHKKFCNKQADTNFARQSRKAVTPKEAQHMTAERREFYA